MQFLQSTVRLSIITTISYALVQGDELDGDLFAFAPDLTMDSDEESFAALNSLDQNIGSDSDIFFDDSNQLAQWTSADILASGNSCDSDVANSLQLPAKQRRDSVCPNAITGGSAGDPIGDILQDISQSYFTVDSSVCPSETFALSNTPACITELTRYVPNAGTFAFDLLGVKPLLFPRPGCGGVEYFWCCQRVVPAMLPAGIDPFAGVVCYPQDLISSGRSVLLGPPGLQN